MEKTHIQCTVLPKELLSEPTKARRVKTHIQDSFHSVANSPVFIQSCSSHTLR